MIVYGDFTCPACYLASWRSDLLDDSLHVVDWRAVEHRPGLPFTGARAGRPELARLTSQWAALASLRMPGEILPGRAPSFVASTQAAVAGYAEAYGAGVAERARRALFRAYWVDGLDIGDPEVLRRLLADTIRSGHSRSQPLREWGYAVTSARGPVTSGAFRLICDWQQQWQQLGGSLEPVLVDGDRPVITGSDALGELGRRLAGRPAGHHDLPTLPSRQPSDRFWT